LVEYIHNKENEAAAKKAFRARSLDKKILEEPAFKPVSEVKRKPTEFSPFNLKTE
jgi:hypothetical protein